MNWALIGLLTVLTGAAQTPAKTGRTLNTQGNRAEESGNDAEAQRLYHLSALSASEQRHATNVMLY